MNKILTLFMLVLSFGISAQSTETSDTTSVGNQLIKFERQYSNGVGIGLAGTIIVIAGSSIVATPIIIAGGVVMILGEIIKIDSHKYIRFAGLLMNKNNIGNKVKQIKQ